MSDMTQNSAALNQAAAHETGLYDPNVHDNQIVALYDTDAQARSAQEVLVQAGFPVSAMQVMARDGAPTTTDTAGVSGMGYERTESEGIWGSIKSLFVPDEERNTYNHAIARGHAMLVVTPDHTMDRHHLIHVPGKHRSARLRRQARGMAPVRLRQQQRDDRRYAGHGGRDGHWRHHPRPAPPRSQPATSRPPPHTTPRYTTPRHTTPRHMMPRRWHPHDTVTSPVTGDESIKVMEERLRIGKREVASGAVRIRSYIVERPIEENVKLHEERVSVDRTPVDRPATSADLAGAFQERTIEARATSEEAVIAKEARVVEEIGLNKQATDRVETIHDTVRKTEVEIEGADAAATHGTLHGSTEGNPNATPGATTSGANSPLK